MRKPSVIIDFRSISDTALPEFCETIEADMLANVATFPAPPVPLLTLKAQRLDFETKVVKVQSGNPADTAAKNAARTVLETSLKTNGKYVDTVANGNEVIMLLSGYNISKTPAPVGEFPAPDFVKVANGDNPAEFEIDIATVEKATGYLVAFTPESNTDPNPYNWMLRWTKKHSNTFTGFQSGIRYKVAAAAVGASDNVNFTNPVTRIAQ